MTYKFQLQKVRFGGSIQAKYVFEHRYWCCSNTCLNGSQGAVQTFERLLRSRLNALFEHCLNVQTTTLAMPIIKLLRIMRSNFDRCKRGGMLRQARFEFVRGQRRRTGVQGKPGPESVVVSGLCCVSTVVVNRCSEHLSEPRPGHNWKLADDLPETNRELAGLRGLPDRSSGVVDCGRVLYPLPQSTAVYRVDGRGFTPQG